MSNNLLPKHRNHSKIPRLYSFYQSIKPLIKIFFFLPHTRSCRFTPSCSQYFTQAATRYGILKGTYLGLRRIARCHPFSRARHDPLPKIS